MYDNAIDLSFQTVLSRRPVSAILCSVMVSLVAKLPRLRAGARLGVVFTIQALQLRYWWNPVDNNDRLDFSARRITEYLELRIYHQLGSYLLLRLSFRTRFRSRIALLCRDIKTKTPCKTVMLRFR